MPLAYIGLGSNLNIPKSQLLLALQYLSRLPRSSIYARSKIYRTKAMGAKVQPHYLNMVVILKTNLPPLHLLEYCQNIEYKQKRIRKKNWGPRTIDLDILLYDQREINYPTLKIPHPYLLQRDFVLAPLLELSPQLCLPNGKKIAHSIIKTEQFIIDHF